MKTIVRLTASSSRSGFTGPSPVASGAAISTRSSRTFHTTTQMSILARNPDPRINMCIIRPHETSARGAVIRRDDVPQRGPAVLGATDNREDAFAATRRHARSLDHVHALLSGAAARGILVRPRHNRVDRTTQAGNSAPSAPAAVIAFPAACLGQSAFDF